MQARAAAAQRRRGLACCLHSAQWDHCDSFGGIGSPCRQPKLRTKTADGRQCDPCHSPASRRSRLDTGHRLSWSAQCEVPPCEAAVIAGTANEQPQFLHWAQATQCFYSICFGKIDVSIVLTDNKC